LASSVQADKIMLETITAYSLFINLGPLCSSDFVLIFLSHTSLLRCCNLWTVENE